jgi:uncharacterized protein (DUF2147 family)
MNIKFATAILLFSAGMAAADPVGEWIVADGTTKIVIKKCGPNLCGRISWTSDGDRTDLGKAILVDLKPMGGEWTGTIVDPRDGQSYQGHVTLQSETSLQVNGCALGGALCGGEVWTRTK